MTRFLLYSHDTYGLGHLRRNTLLAGAITDADPDHEVLIATGSPQAQAFSLPERVDSLKLPSATKNDGGSYRPRKLGGSIHDLVKLRSALVMAAIATYRPEVIVVDHAPLGMAGELVPVLDRFAGRRSGPRFVLGLRDIIDDVDQVDQDWQRSGVWKWLDRYDDIFVYGDPRILTTASELDLESNVRAPVIHTGYVAPVVPEPSADVQPYVLVTPGGGGDGQALLRRYLDAVEAGATSGLRSLVVTGPLMSSARRDELLARAQRSPSVDMIEFSDEMRTLVSSASGVISMAGYNTVVEELAADVPALLVPRCHPRLEQHIRAQRLSPHTRLQHCSLERLDTAAIDEFVSSIAGSSTASVGGGATLPVPGGAILPVPGGAILPVPGGATLPVPGGATLPVPGGATLPVPGGATACRSGIDLDGAAAAAAALSGTDRPVGPSSPHPSLRPSPHPERAHDLSRASAIHV